MSLSNDLFAAWTDMCAEIGQYLPINRIELNMLMHEVDAADPPLKSPSGFVRRVTLAYDYEEYKDDISN